MILAAADHAEDPKNYPPPPELELAWQCKAFGMSPEPGGLRDQRAGEIRRMLTALNIYNAVKSYRQSRDLNAWTDNHPDLWKLVDEVRKLRKELWALNIP